MAFATANDVEIRNAFVFTAREKLTCEALIADAEAMLLSELNEAHVVIDSTDTIQAANLKACICVMVGNVMASAKSSDEAVYSSSYEPNGFNAVGYYDGLGKLSIPNDYRVVFGIPKNPGTLGTAWL